MTFTKVPIPGPYKGIVTDMPSAMDNQAFDDVVNMFCRKGRLQTRPRWNTATAPPDGQAIRAMYTFQDALNFYHTIVLTSSNAYFLTNPTGTALVFNRLNLPSGFANLSGTGLPYAYIELNQQFFFCNGSVPLMYADGSNAVQVAGDVPGACRYLTENSEQLIGAYWTNPAPGNTGSQQYPFLVQYSDTADPTTWTPAADNTAGSIDLIDSGGVITGLGTVGRNSYVLKQYGATVLYPTGVATQPFENEPFMWSKPGWGNFYPYSFVVWGPLIISITESAEVLLFDGTNFTRISSGKIRQQLAQDLALVSHDQIVCFGTSSMGPGYDLEAYWISIPGPNIIWVHDLVEGTWQRMSSSTGWLTSTARVAVL
jgi:hypothetical protein